MSAEYSLEDEQPSLNQPIVMGSIADQQTTDVIEPFKRVPFIIKKATVRTQAQDAKQKVSEDNPWKVHRLAVQASVGPEGVDGEGRYKSKVLFPEFILAFNPDAFESTPSDWWYKSSRGPTKQFIAALGYDPAAPPTIDQEFLESLVGREFIADIKRQDVKRADSTGKYVATGDQENLLINFRALANGNGE